MSNFEYHKMANIYSPLIEDVLPDKIKVGQLALWKNDGREYLGRVVEVDNRKITLKLQKRWMHRTKITVNWRFIQIVPEGYSLKSKVVQSNDNRIDELRKVVEFKTKRKWVPEQKIPDSQIETYISECKNTYENLLLYIEEFETAKEKVQILIKKLNDEQDLCLKHGIPESKLPPRYQAVDNTVIIHRGRRKKNMDHRKKLQDVREETRTLLSALLIASGSLGVTSDEVVSSLCGMTSSSMLDLPLTSHRIMGMLSAFSRRKEAEMVDFGRWRATEKLLSASRSGTMSDKQ